MQKEHPRFVAFAMEEVDHPRFVGKFLSTNEFHYYRLSLETTYVPEIFQFQYQNSAFMKFHGYPRYQINSFTPFAVRSISDASVKNFVLKDFDDAQCVPVGYRSWTSSISRICPMVDFVRANATTGE